MKESPGKLPLGLRGHGGENIADNVEDRLIKEEFMNHPAPTGKLAHSGLLVLAVSKERFQLIVVIARFMRMLEENTLGLSLMTLRQYFKVQVIQFDCPVSALRGTDLENRRVNAGHTGKPRIDFLPPALPRRLV